LEVDHELKHEVHINSPFLFHVFFPNPIIFFCNFY